MRGKGVMEKCTYCVQRISKWRIDAKKKYDPKNPDATKFRDGDVITACQQACPTNAILFGDRNDPDSAVAKAQEAVAELPAARRIEHQTAHDVSGAHPQPEPGAGNRDGRVREASDRKRQPRTPPI